MSHSSELFRQEQEREELEIRTAKEIENIRKFYAIERDKQTTKK